MRDAHQMDFQLHDPLLEGPAHIPDGTLLAFFYGLSHDPKNQRTAVATRNFALPFLPWARLFVFVLWHLWPRGSEQSLSPRHRSARECRPARSFRVDGLFELFAGFDIWSASRNFAALEKNLFQFLREPGFRLSKNQFGYNG